MPTPIYAFFDFDDTLIQGDSIYFWLRYYYARRPARAFFLLALLPVLILRLFRIVPSHFVKRVMLWPLSFESPKALDTLAAHFVRKDLALRFYEPVLEKLIEHFERGHRVVVISASCTFYLQYLQRLLPSCTILGTEVEWGKGFLGLPVYRDGNLRGENKVRRLKELGLGDAGRGAFGYSDHHHDIPLLRFVEHPVCVKPTRGLRKVAQASGWKVWDPTLTLP